MVSTIYFDKHVGGSWSFMLDLKAKNLILSSECVRFIYDIEREIKNKDNGVEPKEVSVNVYWSKDAFVDIVGNVFGLKFERVEDDKAYFSIPEELGIVDFKKNYTFTKVVNYYKDMDSENFPKEISRDLDLVEYFSSCPLCSKGTELKSEGVKGSINNGVLTLHKGNTFISYSVEYCPLCGKKVGK